MAKRPKPPATLDEPRDPVLENAIFEALASEQDATEAFRVYGDWLQQLGHVRGELVALQCAGKDVRATDLLVKRRRELVGPLALLEDRAAGKQLSRPLFEIDWRCGFMRRVKLDDVGRLLHEQKAGIDQAYALQQLLQSPAARFVESLETACPWSHEDRVETRMHETLSDHGPLVALRKLAIVSDEQNSFVKAGNVGHLATTAPNLRSLRIRAGSFDLDALAHPRLEELVIETCCLTADTIATLCGSQWPSLTKLVLWFGSRDSVAADLADLMPLLDAPEQFPVLFYLGLCNNEFADELIEPLAASRLLQRIEYLDLSKATLSDAGATAIVANVERFAHLQEIAVGENFIETPAILSGGFSFDVVGLDEQRVFEPEYYDRRYADCVE